MLSYALLISEVPNGGAGESVKRTVRAEFTQHYFADVKLPSESFAQEESESHLIATGRT
jgi:hypothetical protein